MSARSCKARIHSELSTSRRHNRHSTAASERDLQQQASTTLSSGGALAVKGCCQPQRRKPRGVAQVAQWSAGRALQQVAPDRAADRAAKGWRCMRCREERRAAAIAQLDS